MLSQVRVAVPVTGDHELRAVFGLLECFGEDLAQFGKQWNNAIRFALLLGFRGSHREPVIRPVDIRPAEPQRLARRANATEPGKCHDGSPFHVRTRFQHFAGRLQVDELLARFVLLAPSLHIGEWVLVGESLSHGGFVELPRSLDMLVQCCVGVLLGKRMSPVVGVPFAYRTQVPLLAEKLRHGSLGVVQVAKCVRCEAGLAAVDVGFQKRPQRRRFTFGNVRRKAGGCELLRQIVANVGEPARRLVVGRTARDRSRKQVLDSDTNRIGGFLVDRSEPHRTPAVVFVVELQSVVRVATALLFVNARHRSLLQIRFKS